MGPCPCRCKTCRAGSLGEIRSMEGADLAKMVASTMFGDYPENKDESDG